jgi:hypothetical protein
VAENRLYAYQVIPYSCQQEPLRLQTGYVQRLQNGYIMSHRSHNLQIVYASHKHWCIFDRLSKKTIKMKKSPLHLLLLILLLGNFSACEALNKEPKESTTQPKTDTTASAKLEITAQKLYENFKNPWGMVWLPDGRLLVTEKSGEILVFKDDKFTGQKLSGVPKVSDAGQEVCWIFSCIQIIGTTAGSIFLIPNQ